MRTLAISLTLVFSAPALAAGGIFVGNGGHVVECSDSNGHVASLSTFDLFEGYALNRYRYLNVRDAESVARALAQKIDRGLDRPNKKVLSIAERVDYMIRNKRMLPPGVGLSGTGDTSEFIKLPANCSLRQVVNFRDSRLIYVNSDLWNALAPLDQAALYLHEAVYWYLREPGVEKDSRRARQAVAYAFSGGEFTAPMALPSGLKKFQYCHSTSRDAVGDYTAKLIAYRGENGQPVVQFLNLGGHRFLTRNVWTAPVEEPVDELPLVRKSARKVTATATLQTPIDVDAVLMVAWGRGQIVASGVMQPEDAVRDVLTCQEAQP